MKNEKSTAYKQYLLESYPMNDDSGNMIVEILLERYLYLFDEWDNSSFKRRDLDADLIQFLDDCAVEIPAEFGIELLFGLTEDVRTEASEKMVITSLRNHYRRMMDVENRLMTFLDRRMLINMAIAFALLFSASLLSEYTQGGVLWSTLIEGFFVGGWVFAWTAISTFAFERRNMKRKTANLERLLKAPIRFAYSHEAS